MSLLYNYRGVIMLVLLY